MVLYSTMFLIGVKHLKVTNILLNKVMSPILLLCQLLNIQQIYGVTTRHNFMLNTHGAGSDIKLYWTLSIKKTNNYRYVRTRTFRPSSLNPVPCMLIFVRSYHTYPALPGTLVPGTCTFEMAVYHFDYYVHRA